MTPGTLPRGWTPHAGNSGGGTSAGRRSWHKNSNATFRIPFLGETGHRKIKAVRLQKGTVTNDPKVVLVEVLNSFQRQHHTEDEK